MAFACIYVPDFPVEAVVRVEPDLRSQPLAVLAGTPPRVRVFAVNEKARRAGVEPEMTKLQAEAYSGVVLRQRSALQESVAHAALLDCAQSFSPRVEDTDCDTLLLDLSGLEPLFGPAPKIARDLARRASDLGLEASVAVASNPDAALHAARGFPGVTVIPTGKEAERLGELPLEVLFADATGSDSQDAQRFLETLNRWGVRNLRALAALPEIAVGERLGQQGVRRQKLARGATSRTLVPVELPLKFEEAIELEHPLVLLEPLAFLLARLLEQLCARLATRALAAQELRLKLELDYGTESDVAMPGESRSVRLQGESRREFHRTLRLPVPLLDAKVFLKLLQLDLQAHPPGAPIIKIWLAAGPALPRPGQAGLFLPASPQPEKLELTLARIAGIVGEEKTGSLELLDTHRPEGFRMQRFAPAAPEDKKSAEDSPGTPPITALRLFRPPLRAAVTLREGQPIRMDCSKRTRVHGEIIWRAGPWRTSGDWWDQQPWSREEWDIALETDTGIALYRLVHDRFRGRWLVEGTYD